MVFWRPRSQRKQSPVWTRNSWICLNMGFTQLPWILRDSQHVPIFRQIKQPKFGGGTPHSPRNRHVPMATDPQLPRASKVSKGCQGAVCSERVTISFSAISAIFARWSPGGYGKPSDFLTKWSKNAGFSRWFCEFAGGQCNAILTI